MQSISISNSPLSDKGKITAFFAFVAAALCLMPEVALAADMFASAKTDISDTMFGDTVKYIMWGGAALAGLIVGIFQKNWVMGAVTFFGAMIFWNVASGLLP